MARVWVSRRLNVLLEWIENVSVLSDIGSGIQCTSEIDHCRQIQAITLLFEWYHSYHTHTFLNFDIDVRVCNLPSSFYGCYTHTVLIDRRNSHSLHYPYYRFDNTFGNSFMHCAAVNISKRLSDDCQSTTVAYHFARRWHKQWAMQHPSCRVLRDGQRQPSTKTDDDAGRIIALVGCDCYTQLQRMQPWKPDERTTRCTSPLRLIVERSTERWRRCSRPRRRRNRKDEYDACSDVIVLRLLGCFTGKLDSFHERFIVMLYYKC